MDVFVLPSLAEGISNTILEAMASGLPVLATASGGNVELVEADVTGKLFPVGDDQTLADQLAFLADHPDRRRALGQGARERVTRQFDWEVTVDAYLAVYNGLCGH